MGGSTMIEFDVENKDALDSFDADEAYYHCGSNFCVYIVETGEVCYPVFCIRENGDVDGLMGWK
jgi:hypothetical protein